VLLVYDSQAALAIVVHLCTPSLRSQLFSFVTDGEVWESEIVLHPEAVGKVAPADVMVVFGVTLIARPSSICGDRKRVQVYRQPAIVVQSPIAPPTRPTQSHVYPISLRSRFGCVVTVC